MIEPFLRWAGGKRWLGRLICPFLKERLAGRYIEPFLGSGAMFFSLRPASAILSDLSVDLINTFKMVAKKPEELVTAIQKLPVNRETFMNLRRSEPEDDFERAVRFLYLNRTCYGGLYRENRKGKFNVPYGGGDRTPEPLWRRDLLVNAAKLLSKRSIRIERADFEVTLSEARKGDLVYCDPTYRAVTRKQFDRYGSVVFDWSDQVRLASAAKKARMRGALVIVSNSYSPEISNLYSDAVRVAFRKPKTIGHRARDASNHKEYLFALDPCIGPKEHPKRPYMIRATRESV